jgi:hypothetical protein
VAYAIARGGRWKNLLLSLPLLVYGMVRGNVEPSINAISTTVLLVTTGLVYLADRLAREQQEGGGPSGRTPDRAMPVERCYGATPPLRRLPARPQ